MLSKLMGVSPAGKGREYWVATGVPLRTSATYMGTLVRLLMLTGPIRQAVDNSVVHCGECQRGVLKIWVSTGFGPSEAINRNSAWYRSRVPGINLEKVVAIRENMEWEGTD